MGLKDLLSPGSDETKKTRAALDAANDEQPDPNAIDRPAALVVFAERPGVSLSRSPMRTR